MRLPVVIAATIGLLGGAAFARDGERRSLEEMAREIQAFEAEQRLSGDAGHLRMDSSALPQLQQPAPEPERPPPPARSRVVDRETLEKERRERNWLVEGYRRLEREERAREALAEGKPLEPDPDDPEIDSALSDADQEWVRLFGEALQERPPVRRSRPDDSGSIDLAQRLESWLGGEERGGAESLADIFNRPGLTGATRPPPASEPYPNPYLHSEPGRTPGPVNPYLAPAMIESPPTREPPPASASPLFPPATSPGSTAPPSSAADGPAETSRRHEPADDGRRTRLPQLSDF